MLLSCGCSAPPSANPCANGAGLDPDECLLPWPSSAFLVADPTTRTGFRVRLPASLMPENEFNVPLDPAPWSSWDGFSPMTTLIADFAAAVDTTPLPSWHDPGASLAADSPTVIVDVDSGERVAHFAEKEDSPEVAAGHTTLYLRLAARLAEGHHYAIGIRNLKDRIGSPITAPLPFAELRDGKSSLLDSRRADFERDVFIPLIHAGVDRTSLILAWDFRTASGRTAWGDLVSMRDTAIAIAGANGLGCTVDSVTEDPTDPEIFRQIQGHFTVPNFLQSMDKSVRLARDPQGNPIAQGTTEAAFLAMIPRTALNNGARAPLWIYGHGLFSARDEVTRDFGRDTISKAGAIAAATDYVGLTASDLGGVIGAVEDLNRFPAILDKLRQSIVNTVLLPRTIAGACASLPAFMVNGVSIVGTTGFGYFGNSMGGTLGQTVAALSPDVNRYALGVAGIDFPVMMPRTTMWPELQAFFRIGYPTRLDRDLLLVMSAQLWDLAESSAFAPHVLSSPLPGSQPAQLLFQMGLYDADTTNVASEMAGRTLGLSQLSPNDHAVWGLPQVTAPQQSAFVVYDLGAARPPDTTLPAPVENGVHEGVRRDPRAQSQIVDFLKSNGSVVDTCNGACVPMH